MQQAPDGGGNGGRRARVLGVGKGGAAGSGFEGRGSALFIEVPRDLGVRIKGRGRGVRRPDTARVWLGYRLEGKTGSGFGRHVRAKRSCRGPRDQLGTGGGPWQRRSTARGQEQRA